MTNAGEAQRQALAALVARVGTNSAPSGAAAILLPASDYFDLAGEEFGRRLLLTEGADGTQYCLRPDFTLPIARSFMAQGNTKPAAYAYLGPVFRQRKSGPSEFDQAGLELIAQPNPNDALYQVFEFSRDALKIFGFKAPKIRLGSVALFEALLAAADMPDVWRPRLRRRFGNQTAMQALLKRLAHPHKAPQTSPKNHSQLVEEITRQMMEDGLPLSAGRQAQDIANRYLEKQALAEAKVPASTIALFEQYLSIEGPLEKAVGQIKNLLSQTDISLEPHLNDLQKHAQVLAKLFPASSLNFEASFSPRLHYYTGLVFELNNMNNQTLVSGGQYDRLLQALGASNKISASGCAIWVKRLEAEQK